ncbi:nuclear transcription factor Y subunit beta [Drosophila sulfurigaster albostrigata]|uniref:nuclear transcription factor Y subunit beta n=1 Tax=Drosophila sulfurigaster albostrigata TaxID=89887 RepID=UPI002D21C101|nr:nuclear transcription factor Y subunit beta [Drosophila sulfurigaster albostrigata]
MSNNQEELINKQFQHEEPPIVINDMQYDQIQDNEIHEDMHLEGDQHRNIQHEEFQHQAMPANFQNNLEESSLKMETLRMDTPSPTTSSTSQQSLLNGPPSKSKVPSKALDLPLSRSKLKNNKQNAQKPATISQQSLLNEQPSTSKDAREALELSLNRSQSKNNKQDAQKPDAISQQSLLNEPPSKSKVASEGMELPLSRSKSKSNKQDTQKPATISQQSLLNEQPSTSKAAREALELSLNRSQSKNKQDAHKPENKATKKRRKQSPLTSEPQQSKIKTQKNKERQRLEDSETYPLNEKHFASGIRKSERGQVPLCNTFCHTLDDPFAFMRSPDKKFGNKSNTSSRKKLSNNSNDITSNGDNTLKRKRYPHEDDDAQGNSPNKNVRKRKMTSANIESTPDQLVHTQAKKPNFANWLQSDCKKKPERNFQIMADCRSQRVSTLGNLEHSNLNGIECASYPSEIGCSLSYIKFQPFQKWGIAGTNSTLNFIVLSGMLEIKNWQASSKLESAILNNGDKVEIPQGCYFILTNLLNKVSVMLFKRILTDNNTLS